jgi:hypothetical protein
MGAGDRGFFTGTPSATFSTTGFTCAELALYETSYFVDWWLRFYSGTHKDISREVTTFTTSTGAIVFSPATTGAIDATDLFELWRDWTPEEVNAAINLAISMVENEWLIDKSDVTLVVVADTYEYTVPSGFYSISQIYQEESTSGKYSKSSGLIDPEKGWSLFTDSSNIRKLWFDPEVVSLTTGRKLRIEGQAVPGQLTLDASTTTVPLPYLVQQAKALLHQSKIDGRSSASQQHEVKFKLAQEMADRERRSLQVISMGQRV